jgi:hypothetical protein
MKDLPSLTILLMNLKIMPDFSDEATYHISGKVSRHNCHIWDSEIPQEVWQHERDSPNVIFWCALGKTNIIGPTFFEAVVVNDESYLEMVQCYFNPD